MIAPKVKPTNAETQFENTPIETKRPLPLGHTKNQGQFPFMGRKHVNTRVDGKTRAQKNEETVVALIDLERGLRCLTDDYLELIYKYYLFQTHNAYELCLEKNYSSVPSMWNKCERALATLTRHMNSGGKVVRLKNA